MNVSGWSSATHVATHQIHQRGIALASPADPLVASLRRRIQHFQDDFLESAKAFGFYSRMSGGRAAANRAVHQDQPGRGHDAVS